MTNLKIYFRVLFKNKVLSLINLLGLALGISSCIFITLFVLDELGYDSQHQNLDRIFRVATKIVSESSVDDVPISSSPLAYALMQNYPEVEEAVRFSPNTLGEVSTIKQGNNLYKEKDVHKADANVFKVFSYKMISGNPQEALVAPLRVVLTQSIAKKYFDSEEPLGKTLTIGQKDHLVTGVMEDLPLNSDLKITMLTSMDSTDRSDDWFDISYYTYVLFNKKSLSASGFVLSFEKKLNELVNDKMNRPLRENKQNITCSIHFQPLQGIHFQPSLLYDTPKGNKNYIYIFTCVAFLILIIGCLNYINFSIVQSIERSKEVGIRKVIGASFSQLVSRYIGESFLFTLLALMLALAFAILMMPVLNDVTSKDFGAIDLFDSKIAITLCSILLVVGILAGSYPAFYTSSIKPVSALKGKVTTPKGQAIRKISIAAQFFISIGLMICTAIVHDQMTFIKNYDLGFKKDNILVITTPSDTTLYPKTRFFKEGLLKNPDIKLVAAGGIGSLPGSSPELGGVTIKTDGKDDVRMVNFNYVDEDYIKALDIRVIQGRNYDGRASDMKNSIMVNEALVNMMGWKNPLEQKIVWKSTIKDVIGVVRDFHFRSLYNKVEPQLLVYHDKEISTLFVVLNGARLSDRISQIREEWNKVFTDEPFVYRFLDESINAQYQSEEKAMNVFTYFSILTIVISCLGLFGLSSLTVYQRKKEIGIRKIVGADFLSIIILFAKEYIGLICIAIISVSPLAWLMMNHWLESFPYRKTVTFSIFIIIGAGVILVSLFTIIFSISKILKSKPVNLIAEPS